MSKITTTFNFGNGLPVKSLLALVAIGVTALLPCPVRSTDTAYSPTPEVTIRCHPPVLYRGDDLVVGFGGSPHNNFDFGIQRAAVHGRDPDELFLLSFEPG